LKKLFEAWFKAKVIKVVPAPVPKPAPIPTPAPVIITDDAECELVIKYNCGEVPNSGQVTYIKRFVTASMFDGHSCVCVQYNDASQKDGERLVFKDQSRTGDWSGQLPTDISISKLVVWYE